MNQLKKLFAVAALTACVLPVAAQYPVIPDSVKIRGEEQQKEIDRKSDEAWAKAANRLTIKMQQLPLPERPICKIHTVCPCRTERPKTSGKSTLNRKSVV